MVFGEIWLVLGMESGVKLLYIVVVDERERNKGLKPLSFRYTRPVLQSILQLMGCKPRQAFKVSVRLVIYALFFWTF